LTEYDSKKFTQELRLSSVSGSRLEWLVGLFYDNERNSGNQLIAALNPGTGAQDGVFISADEPSTYQEKAGFVSLTYHFTEAFDTQVGARYDHTFSSYDPTGGGILVGPTRTELSSATDNSTTWQFTPRYHFSKDVMSYLRIATGFRPGGANVPTTGSPPTFGADKTVDYELGLKATLLEDRLTLDGSLFWIDWRNPQITETNPASQSVFFGNADRARSRGLNLEAAFIPWQGMTVSGNAAFTDAVLTDALPADADAFAPSGDRLPYSARFTGYLSAEQRFKLAGDINPFVAAGVTYVGQRFSEFAANASVPRFSLPSYTTLDLRGGVYFGSWSCSLVVRNLTDERGWLSGGLNVTTDPALGSTISVIQPRTIGLSAAYKF
jgi:iron complex outermembrane receptor protein